MAQSIFDQPRFQDAEAARVHLEAIRWPNGPVCPHCGGMSRNTLMQGKAHRAGLYSCGDCREQFTVTVGTVFERSKIALHKWVMATHLMCASKKGISAKQLERMLGVTYKTAWFMAHRIREAMKTEPTTLMGSGGGIVEADETYWGNGPQSKIGKIYKDQAHGGHHKEKIFALVERGGNVRSFHVKSIDVATLKDVMNQHVSKEANLMTDEARFYKGIGKAYASHESVKHSMKEYARGNVSTNTIEGYFSIFKRGLIGTFHHVGEQHLKRYCTEFDFRYNTRTSLGFNDFERTDLALKGITGKRLMYQRPDAKQAN